MSHGSWHLCIVRIILFGIVGNDFIMVERLVREMGNKLISFTSISFFAKTWLFNTSESQSVGSLFPHPSQDFGGIIPTNLYLAEFMAVILDEPWLCHLWKCVLRPWIVENEWEQTSQRNYSGIIWLKIIWSIYVKQWKVWSQVVKIRDKAGRWYQNRPMSIQD